MISRRELFDRSWRYAVALAMGSLAGEWWSPPDAEAANLRYINKSLTTGANNGTSAADAYRGPNALERFRAGSGSSTVDRVIFQGGGVYQEAFSTAATRVKTDISFTAATRTIASASSNFTTLGFQSGDIIRVSGSLSNDRQFTVDTVGTTTMTVVASNILTEEAAGEGVNIVDLTRGSNIAGLDPGGNATAARPRVWQFNGAEIDAGVDLDSWHGYSWTPSPARPDEWYVTRSDGSNPSLQRVYSGVIDGAFVCDASDIAMQMGTVGALDGRSVWGWGDNDSLGFSTLYMYSPSVNPNGLTVRAGQLPACIATSWEYHSWEDGIFSLANRYAAITSGMCLRNGGAQQWWAKRCVARWATFHGFEGGKLRCDACLTYWTGHRGYAQGGSATMEVYHCVDRGSHLFALISSSSTGTLIVRNCISSGNEAGAIYKQGAGGTLIEDHNLWYPAFGASGAALGYIGTANWSITHSTDFPPAAATTISTPVGIILAGGENPYLLAGDIDTLSDVSLVRAELKLQSTSGGKWSGTPVPFVKDYRSRRFSPSHPSRGLYEFGAGDPAGTRNLRP